MHPKLPRGFSHPMRIGSGAFASVYRVHQSALDRKVALKIIHEKNIASRNELLREAKTQANLRANCVPQVFDAFEWKKSVCMVMEWVRGIPLSTLLQVTLDEAERLSLAHAFIGALAEIHRLGCVHRDLKPENILLSPEHGLFLVDFGFSRTITDATMSSITTAKGTPAYMAPELWSAGVKTDLMRADIYAAGKILMQLLDGTRFATFSDTCVNVNPLLRPASGVELVERWNALTGNASFARVWEKRANEIASEELSRNLLAGAKTLLAAERFDEAYWLLVESVEENGGNHDAIHLLGSFREKTGSKRNVRKYALFGIVLIFGIVGAFLVGTASKKGTQLNRAAQEHTSHFLQIGSMQTVASIGQASLRRDSLSTDKLSGTILLRTMPRSGIVITIDGDTLSAHQMHNNGIFVPAGSHEVVFYDTIEQMVKRESVTVLPFQTRAVDGFRTTVP